MTHEVHHDSTFTSTCVVLFLSEVQGELQTALYARRYDMEGVTRSLLNLAANKNIDPNPLDIIPNGYGNGYGHTVELAHNLARRKWR